MYKIIAWDSDGSEAHTLKAKTLANARGYRKTYVSMGYAVTIYDKDDNCKEDTPRKVQRSA